MKTAAPKTTAALQRQPAPQEQGPFFRKEGEGKEVVRGAEVSSSEAPSGVVSLKREGSLWGNEPFFQPAKNGNPGPIQAKLTIGRPNDKYEQEADRMAETVVERVSHNDARGGEDAVQTKEARIQEKPIFESEEAEGTEETVQTKCAACEQEEQAQRKEETEQSPQEESIREKGESGPVDILSGPAVQLQEEEPEEIAVQEAPALEPTEPVRGEEPVSPEVQPKVKPSPPAPAPAVPTPTVARDIEPIQKKEEEQADLGPEEELRRSPVFESAAPPPEEEGTAMGNTLMAKSEDGALTGTSHLQTQLDATKGAGDPLPENTRTEMESGFGSDFSGVRIHTGSQAAEMNQGLHAQAFTHGSDIYFNEGKYDPESGSGKKLLAHELTHTVQQGGSNTINQLTEIPVRTGAIQRYVLPNLKSMRYLRYERHKDDVVDLEWMSAFSPNSGLGKYIGSLWLIDKKLVKVNIKFGSVLKGKIWIRQNESYSYKECFWILACRDLAPEKRNYYAPTQVFPINHSSMDPKNKGSVVLSINIERGVISGKLGFIEGKKPSEIDSEKDVSKVRYRESDFLGLVYGNAYSGQNYYSFIYKNVLIGGFLQFMTGGKLELPHEQKINGGFGLINEISHWKADLEGRAKGIEDFKFPVERTPEGQLFGDSESLALDKNWSFGTKKDGQRGFTLEGELRASYANNVMEAFGKAKYQSQRISGEANLALTNEKNARVLFEQHVPVEAKKVTTPDLSKDNADGSKAPMALIGWGGLCFRLIKREGSGDMPIDCATIGQDLEGLEGSGSFVVDPTGHIITAGKLKFPTEWEFTKTKEYPKGFDPKEPKPDPHFPSLKFVTEFPVPYGTVYVKLSAFLSTHLQLFPIKLYEIEISGVYSNHPEYQSELGITPKLRVQGLAELIAVVSAEGGYKLGGLFKLLSIKGTINAKGMMHAYVIAAPTINIIQEKIGAPAKYGISGKIHGGGELTLGISGEIEIEIAKLKKVRKEFKQGDPETVDYDEGAWKLGNMGFDVDLKEYIIGSGDEFDISFNKTKFDKRERRALAKAIAKEKKRKEGEKDKQTGGFSQEVEGKNKEIGEFSTTKPVIDDASNDPISFDLRTDFFMEEKLHKLFLEVTGTRQKPKADLFMASDKEELDEKLRDEKSELDSWWNSAFEKQQLKDLESIKADAKAVKETAEEVAQQENSGDYFYVAGYEELSRRLTNYGKKHNRDDLGNKVDLMPNDQTQDPSKDEDCNPGVGLETVKNKAKSLSDEWGFNNRKGIAWIRNKAAASFTICYKDGTREEVIIGVPSSSKGKNAIEAGFKKTSLKKLGNFNPSSTTGDDQNQLHSENMIIEYSQTVGREADNRGKIDKIILQIYSFLEICDPCDNRIKRKSVDTGLGYQVIIREPGSSNAPRGVIFQRAIVDGSASPPPPYDPGTVINTDDPKNIEPARKLTKNQDSDWFKTFKVKDT